MHMGSPQVATLVLPCTSHADQVRSEPGLELPMCTAATCDGGKLLKRVLLLLLLLLLFVFCFCFFPGECTLVLCEKPGLFYSVD